MNTVRMVATQPMSYPFTTPRKIGEEFDCEEAHVAVFELQEKAKRVENQDRKQTYSTRVMTAAQQRNKAVTKPKKPATRKAH